MADGEELFGALRGWATEAGRTLREWAAYEGRKIRGDHAVQWPTSMLRGTGPVIPEPYKRTGQGVRWQDGFLLSCAVQVARAAQNQEFQPVTLGLAALQGALHCKSGGYELLQVGLNAHKVLDKGEWGRVPISAMLHLDLPHLAGNATGLILEGMPLEERLGSARFGAVLASTTATSQGLYLLVSRLAKDWLPQSVLGTGYFKSFAVGFSGVGLALKVITGYMREADLAAAGVAPPDEFVLTSGRLAAWPALIVTHFVVPNASLAGHMCGVAAGVLHVYGARALGWLARKLRLGGGGGGRGRRRLQDGRLVPAGRSFFSVGSDSHPGLGWLDLASHGVFAAAAVLIAKTAEQRGGGKA